MDVKLCIDCRENEQRSDRPYCNQCAANRQMDLRRRKRNRAIAKVVISDRVTALTESLESRGLMRDLDVIELLEIVREMQRHWTPKL